MRSLVPEPVQRALEREGREGAQADRARRELIDFGRTLFVEEWMKPLAGEDEVLSEAEGSPSSSVAFASGRGSQRNTQTTRHVTHGRA